MLLTDSPVAIPCGSVVINRTRVPIYKLACGTEVVEQVDAVSGLPEIISVSGAKRFKRGYPFHPDLEPAVSGTHDIPVALMSEEEQDAEGASILRAIFNRVLDSGVAFDFLPV